MLFIFFSILLAGTWVEFIPDNGGYTISVPEGTVYNKMGDDAQVIDLLSAPSDGGQSAKYWISISKIYSDVETNLSIVSSEELKNGILSSCNCSLTSPQEVKMIHVSALRYRMTTKAGSGNQMACFIYLVPDKDRVFNLTFMTLIEDVSKYQVEAEQIIGSFKPL